MPLLPIPCGPPVNHSEQLAAERAKSILGALPGDWVLLTNLALITSPDRQPDDLDMVIIGSCGVLLIEVKHWDAPWVAANEFKTQDEARKLCDKAKRLGSLVRRALGNAANVRVDQAFLLTREPTGSGLKDKIAGAPVWSLKSLAADLKKLPTSGLTKGQIGSITQALEPRTRLQLEGKQRRIGDYHNLELATPQEQRFHRIYRGVHRRTLEKVLVHVYDLSASSEKDPLRVAKREYEALQVLQKCRYVARMRDSFQELPDYPGEVYLYTIFDVSAPSVERRAKDESWTLEARTAYAAECFEALREIHGMTDDQATAIIHRQLSPAHLLVGPRNRPLITGFELARLPATQTIAGNVAEPALGEWVAPEIKRGGLIGATMSSDVYALCHGLLCLFSADSPQAEVLHRGLHEVSSTRASLDDLEQAWQALIAPAAKLAEPPAHERLEASLRAEFWSEGTEITFGKKSLRVLGSLGAGGVGRTFKVEHFDPATDETFGTFVAKVIHAADAGRAALTSYNRVKPHSDGSGLATVFDVADEWAADRVVALLQWIPGESLHGLRDGLVDLAMSECRAADIAALLKQWLIAGCNALALLHLHGLVHGDVSPKNLIYRPGELTLTDFDLVTRSGCKTWGTGALAFASQEAATRNALLPSDDVYALAASLFSVAFDRESPFTQAEGSLDRSRGLHWRPDDRLAAGHLTDFLTRPQPMTATSASQMPAPH